MLLLAACGEDISGEDLPIRVGLLAPFSGALQGYGPAMRNAVLMAVDEINRAGGVVGRSLDVPIKNDGTAAGPSTAAALELAADPTLVAVVGPATSTSVRAVVTALAQQAPPHVTVVSPTATAPELTNLSEQFYRTVASDAYQGIVAADKARALGKSRASILHVDNAYGRGLSKMFEDRFTSKGGTVVAKVSYPALDDYKDYDFTAEAKAVLAPGSDEPDLVFLVTYFEDGAKFTLFASKQVSGSSPLFFGCDGNKGLDFVTGADATLIEGMMGTAPALDQNDVNYRAFADRYRQIYKLDPKPYAENAYDALYLVAYALERVDRVARSVFTRAAMQAVSGTDGGSAVGVNQWQTGRALVRGGGRMDYKGASGDINWDAAGDVDPSGVTYEIWKIEQGQIVQVETIKPQP